MKNNKETDVNETDVNEIDVNEIDVNETDVKSYSDDNMNKSKSNTDINANNKENEEEEEENEKREEEEPVNLQAVLRIINNIFLVLAISLILISLLLFLISFINLFLIFYYMIIDIYKNIFNYNNIYSSSNKYLFLTKFKEKNVDNDMLYISMEQNYIWKCIIMYYIIIILLLLTLFISAFMFLYAYFRGKKILGSTKDLNKEFIIIFVIIFVYILIKYIYFILYYKIYIKGIYEKINIDIDNIDNYIYKILYPYYNDSNSDVDVDIEIFNYLNNNDIDLFNNKINNLILEKDTIKLKSFLLLYTLYRYFTSNITKKDDNYLKVIEYLGGGKDRYNISFTSLLNIQNKKIIEKYYEELNFFENFDENNEEIYINVIDDTNKSINFINKYILKNDRPDIPFFYLLMYIIINFFINLIFIVIIIIIVKDSKILPSIITKNFNILYNFIIEIKNILKTLFFLDVIK